MTEDEHDDGWTRGFPTESGMYHVLLNDGEQIITPWNSGGGVDTWGDARVLGWVCLSDWRGRVYGWRCLPELPRGFKPSLATPGAAPSGDIWRADTITDGPRIVPIRPSSERLSEPLPPAERKQECLDERGEQDKPSSVCTPISQATQKGDGEHKDTCGFALYGPPAICTCGISPTPSLDGEGKTK
jgi:hypothetical protein